MSRISNLSSRIFVGGLNQVVNEEDLEKAFKLFGEITNVIVMRDRENGRSRGFAFISFKDSQSSEEAISRMHGVEIRGKCVSVRHAERAKHLDEQPRQQSSESGGFRNNGPGPAPMHSQPFNRGDGYRRNLQPSDRVFVTQDEDQTSSDRQISRRSRSPINWQAENYREASPGRRLYAAREPFSQPNAAGSYPSRYVSAEGPQYADDYASGVHQGQAYGSNNYGYERELSPAREINAYINSRGKNYSPLLQLGQKWNASRERERENYDASPIQDSGRNIEVDSSERRRVDRRDSHGHSQNVRGRGVQDREYKQASPARRGEYRSRSPRSRDAYSNRPSLGSRTVTMEPREGHQTKDYYRTAKNNVSRGDTSRRDQRRSPVQRHDDRGRQRRSPQRSATHNDSFGRSDRNHNERFGSSRRSPQTTGPSRQENFDNRFPQVNSRDRNENRGVSPRIKTAGARDDWSRKARRDSPPRGRGTSFDDRASYGNRVTQHSRDRQIIVDSNQRNRERSPRGRRGDWDQSLRRGGGVPPIADRNSPPRRVPGGGERGFRSSRPDDGKRGEFRPRHERSPVRRPPPANRRY